MDKKIKILKRKVYKEVITPILRIYKRILWRLYLLSNKDIQLVIGAANTKFKGWFSTDIETLDVTNEDHFKQYFHKQRIKKILAEHVLEHLTDDDLHKMLKNFYKYSSDDVTIRIAVPDGFHQSDKYIEYVKPNGIGEGSDDHKNLFNYNSLTELFNKYGFVYKLVEYWDENRVFHKGYVNDENGFVERSFLNDLRNSDGQPNYTSLIIDFHKNT